MHIKLILCIAIVFSMQYLPGAADNQEPAGNCEPYDIKNAFILTALNELKEGSKERHEDKVNQAAQWLAQFYLLQYQEEKHSVHVGKQDHQHGFILQAKGGRG